MTPLTNDMLADIRSRINPAYRDTPGTESHERALLVGEIERLRAALAASAERHARIVENYCGAWDDQGFALAAMIRADSEPQSTGSQS